MGPEAGVTAPLPPRDAPVVVRLDQHRTPEQRRSSGHLYAAMRRRGITVPQIALDEQVPQSRVYDDLRAAGYNPGTLRNEINSTGRAPVVRAVPEIVTDEGSGQRFERVPLGADFVAMLHQVRDEIRAADRRAIEAEIKEERRLRG